MASVLCNLYGNWNMQVGWSAYQDSIGFIPEVFFGDRTGFDLEFVSIRRHFSLTECQQ
jgi:hypothetical protein